MAETATFQLEYGTKETYVFYVPPELIDIQTPSRLAVYQSIYPRVHIDHLGQGIETIKLQGTTGWRVNGAFQGLFAYASYKLLRNIIDLYNQSPTENLKLIIATPDAPNFGQWYVVPEAMSLRRSAQSPLLFLYEISFICISQNLEKFDQEQFKLENYRTPIRSKATPAQVAQEGETATKEFIPSAPKTSIIIGADNFYGLSDQYEVLQESLHQYDAYIGRGPKYFGVTSEVGVNQNGSTDFATIDYRTPTAVTRKAMPVVLDADWARSAADAANLAALQNKLLSPSQVQIGKSYKVEVIGTTTNWQKMGGPAIIRVGTQFVVTAVGNGDGKVSAVAASTNAPVKTISGAPAASTKAKTAPSTANPKGKNSSPPKNTNPVVFTYNRTLEQIFNEIFGKQVDPKSDMGKEIISLNPWLAKEFKYGTYTKRVVAARNWYNSQSSPNEKQMPYLEIIIPEKYINGKVFSDYHFKKIGPENENEIQQIRATPGRR